MPLPLRYTLGNLAVRRTRTALTVAVIASVVVVTALMLGLVSSLHRTLVSTGSERNLIVLRKGALSDASSYLPVEAYQAFRFLDGVARDGDEPLASPELVARLFIERLDGTRDNVIVRGVEPVALRVHDELRIVEGRWPATGSTEAAVGRSIADRYAGAEIGSELQLGDHGWQVVGRFESGGSSYESEIWVEARQLAGRLGYDEPYTNLRLRVRPGADMDALAARIDEDPRFSLEARRETEFYSGQADQVGTLYGVVLGLAILAGLGAAFGAANTLYASVQGRRTEIGTLRTIGFSRASILLAFVAEALAMALLGFALGGIAAWALARAVSAASGGVAFFSASMNTSIVPLSVGPADLAVSLAVALAVGLLGGSFPAFRAARLRPAEALRRGAE